MVRTHLGFLVDNAIRDLGVSCKEFVGLYVPSWSEKMIRD